MKTSKKKLNSYLYSQKIATVASGHSEKLLGLYTELFVPMTDARMKELDKKVQFFIKKMEGIYKPDKYEDDGGAIAYFINGIQSKTCAKNEDGCPDYTRVNPINGIFSVNDKANVHSKIEDVEKNFTALVEHWLGDLSYYSDRWCYSRFVTFKLTYFLIQSRWRGYQYNLQHPENL